MHRIKYDLAFTRRHFLESVARGAVGAGILMPVWDAIAKTGDTAAAYPEELLSIEKYTKGRIKPGEVAVLCAAGIGYVWNAMCVRLAA